MYSKLNFWSTKCGKKKIEAITNRINDNERRKREQRQQSINNSIKAYNASIHHNWSNKDYT